MLPLFRQILTLEARLGSFVLDTFPRLHHSPKIGNTDGRNVNSGGHGKVSQLLTTLVLSRSWQLTSVIRDAAQEPTITSLGENQPGQLNVLVSSIEDVKTQAQAQSVIDSTSPTYIVWSAGAGGKGGSERTLAVDRDACIAFISAATATISVSKFILISYLGSRRFKAPWWSDADWSATQDVNNGV